MFFLRPCLFYGLGLACLMLSACQSTTEPQPDDDPQAQALQARLDTLSTAAERFERSLPELQLDANGQADLSLHGVKAKLTAPQGTKVSETGKVIPSLSLRLRDSFWISVETADYTFIRDRKKLKEQALKQVKQLKNFSQIVLEEEFGFVFELDFKGQKCYNFRYVVLGKDLYHIFRTSVLNCETQAQVQAWYESLKRDNS